MLKIYNTLTRKKEEFKPLHGKDVLMYTCGPTVYDYAHIGNLRAFIFEDLLRRVLEFDGYAVKQVMNFTDVGHMTSDADEGEDKMEVGARRERKTAWQLADFYIHAFKQDFFALRMKEPTWVRATDNIQEMTDLVQTLQDRGYTYTIKDGVYFDTSKFKDYGKLARLDVKGLKAGARVEIAEGKIHPTDFALWKFSKTKRDMEWDSPFGRGFPGWHIECSAMAMKYLGATIDIHCGGVDHIAVHHTNEIAQSEAATGEPFSRYWLHNEFMLVDGKKMSKSLGNYYTLKDLTERRFQPVAFRYLCLASHYRSQINFTTDALTDCEKTVKNINDFVHRLKHSNARGNNKTIDKELEKTEKIFTESVNDDLNMPKALAALFDLMRSVNGEIDAGRGCVESLNAVHAFFVKINSILDILEEIKTDLNDEEKKLIELREHFRRQKDFKAADDIRTQLKERGIEVEDTVHGMRWKRI